MGGTLLLSFGAGDDAGSLYCVRGGGAGNDDVWRRSETDATVVSLDGCVYERFNAQRRWTGGGGGGLGGKPRGRSSSSTAQDDNEDDYEEQAYARQRAYNSLGACAALIQAGRGGGADEKKAFAFANDVHAMLTQAPEQSARAAAAPEDADERVAGVLDRAGESCVWELLMLTFLEDYGGASPAWNIAGFFGRHAAALCPERVRHTAALLQSAAAGIVEDQEEYWFAVAACAATGDAGGVGVALLRQHGALRSAAAAASGAGVPEVTSTMARVVETLIQLFSDRPTIADVSGVMELAEESARWQAEAIAVFEELQRAAGMGGNGGGGEDDAPGENYALLEGPLLVAGALMSGDKIIDMVCENWFELFVAMLVSRYPAAHAGHGKEIVALLQRCIQRKAPADADEAWWAELVQQSFEKKTAAVLQLLGARSSPWMMAFAPVLFAQCAPTVSATVARRVQALGNATIREVYMVQYLLTLTSIADSDAARRQLFTTAVRSLVSLCPTLGASTAAQMLRHASLCTDTGNLALVDESHVFRMLHLCSLVDSAARSVGGDEVSGAALGRLIALKYGTMKFGLGREGGVDAVAGLFFLIEARNRARIQQALNALVPFSPSFSETTATRDAAALVRGRFDCVSSMADLDPLVRRRCDAAEALQMLRGRMAADGVSGGSSGSSSGGRVSVARSRGAGKRAFDLVTDALARGDISVAEAPAIALSLISVFEDVVVARPESPAAQAPATRGDVALLADAVERRWSSLPSSASAGIGDNSGVVASSASPSPHECVEGASKRSAAMQRSLRPILPSLVASH